MTGARAEKPPGWPAMVATALLMVGLPALVATLSPAPPPRRPAGTDDVARRTAGDPPPPVQPQALRDIPPVKARLVNAAVPFSTAPNPAAQPYRFAGPPDAFARATACLAAAMLYEAGDDATGERAVGQVVLNRARHPAFPASVCGVVFQGAERSTGCQFTFTCDGAMARIPRPEAWDRARMLSTRMLKGDVYAPVGLSTHYHTDWVVPYWSATLEKVAAVDTHLFFRWPGWWGTPGAFRKGASGADEPRIAALAPLSPDHGVATASGTGNVAAPAASLIDDAATPLAITSGALGTRIGGARLLAVNPAGDAFAVAFAPGGDLARFEAAAAKICAGRSQCRLLGWTDAGKAPQAFPLNEAQMAAMSYAYLRVKETGLERSLYNCRELPAAPKTQCMRERAPAPPVLPARQGRETLKLRALPPAACPAASNAAEAPPLALPKAP